MGEVVSDGTIFIAFCILLIKNVRPLFLFLYKLCLSASVIGEPAELVRNRPERHAKYLDDDYRVTFD